MKRSVAFALTAVIFVAIAFCFFRPAPSVFGYTDVVYDMGWLELEGDTEYFAAARGMGLCGTELALIPAEGKYLYIADDVDADFFDNGEPVIIEKWVDDEWKYVTNAGRGGSYTAIKITPSQYVLSWEDSPLALNFQLCAPFFTDPVNDPGEYRLTVPFYEATRPERGEYIRGDGQQHRVSFNLTVPERTDKDFDVLSVGLRQSGIYPCFEFCLRRNGDAEFPYIDADSMKLTHTKDGVTKSVESVTAGRAALELAFDNGTRGSGDIGDYSLIGITVPLDEFDREGIYTATMDMTENEDGSGERHTLTLKLNFE